MGLCDVLIKQIVVSFSTYNYTGVISVERNRGCIHNTSFSSKLMNVPISSNVTSHKAGK
jgi:hypothetical protein